MRKLLICIFAAVAAVLLISSCEDRREGTYTFFRKYSYNISKGNVDELKAYIKDTDEYLAEGARSQGTGKYSEVINNEIAIFEGHCNKLDGKYIKSFFSNENDYFAIEMWCTDPAFRVISIVWYERTEGTDKIEE